LIQIKRVRCIANTNEVLAWFQCDLGSAHVHDQLSGKTTATWRHFLLRHLGGKMPYTWYVTFEMHQRGVLPKRRSPRATRRFESEAEARNFARAQFNQGLSVFAGTINPHTPRQLIPSSKIPLWLQSAHDQDIADPTNAEKEEEEEEEEEEKS
jgi:hypothetical protein